MPKYIDAPHAKSPEAVCAFFGVNPQKGLSKEQVEQQVKEYGLNELAHEESKSILSLILEQFEDLLVRILLGAAVVSFLLAYFEGHGDEGITAYIEPLVILLILIANAAVGVWQESNAESALAALKSLQPELAHVIRDGKSQSINAEQLVPGDIVEVRGGDKVPADLRIIQLKTTTLKVEQSMLTGECQSVQKQTELVPTIDCEVQAKVNCMFASTTIASGAAIGIVTHTGMASEIGKIHEAVQLAKQEDTTTPLQKKIDDFGEKLSYVIGAICVIVWIINFKNFSDPIHGGFFRGCVYYFKIAVALAVAAIPEGLPAVITTCLALGTRKMAQKNAIVRRLPSVETLGCTTVICSDKTGTLTTNEMTAVRFFVPKTSSTIEVYKVDGHSYAPVGKISNFTSIGDADKGMHQLAKVLAICNESKLELAAGKYTRMGEPTEAALRVLVEKMGCPDKERNEANLQRADRDPSHVMTFSEYWSKNIKQLAMLEFSRDRKSMSVLCREDGAKQNIQYVKGAPESILERCEFTMTADGKVEKLSKDMRAKITSEIEKMASDALRTLACAVRLDCADLKDYDGPKHKAHVLLTDTNNFAKLENNLVFCGVVAIEDPPRPEVADSIRECKVAGIKVMMITGDNKLTAEAIARKIGILKAGKSEDGASQSMTGKEFELLPDEKKVELLREQKGFVFSRTEPRHKQMIVKILKDIGEITAMTGDGVNDAPALKMADIGIAMGIAGTEVAKEASDMVLADDNFSTIVAAVEEGRSIYNNMKAFIRYLISSNIGEVASIFITAALGIPESLAPVQLLWVNLVTDGLPATALGFNPPDVDVMKKPPRRSDDALISGWVFFRYLVIGLYVGVATVGIFVWWFVYGVDPADGNTLLTFDQLAHWSQCRSWDNFEVTPVYGMDGKDPCAYFSAGKIKACTLSLTVLVVIEMFNALNALSEDGSLFQMPPWANPWLLLAIVGSVTVHFGVLYIPPLAAIFNVVPLSALDWYHVLIWSAPVLLIDEVLKFVARSSASLGGNKVAPRVKHE